jgi:hypothetical protein
MASEPSSKAHAELPHNIFTNTTRARLHRVPANRLVHHRDKDDVATPAHRGAEPKATPSSGASGDEVGGGRAKTDGIRFAIAKSSTEMRRTWLCAALPLRRASQRDLGCRGPYYLPRRKRFSRSALSIMARRASISPLMRCIVVSVRANSRLPRAMAAVAPSAMRRAKDAMLPILLMEHSTTQRRMWEAWVTQRLNTACRSGRWGPPSLFVRRATSYDGSPLTSWIPAGHF